MLLDWARGGWKEVQVIKSHVRALIALNFAESANLSSLTQRNIGNRCGYWSTVVFEDNIHVRYWPIRPAYTHVSHRKRIWLVAVFIRFLKSCCKDFPVASRVRSWRRLVGYLKGVFLHHGIPTLSVLSLRLRGCHQYNKLWTRHGWKKLLSSQPYFYVKILRYFFTH